MYVFFRGIFIVSAIIGGYFLFMYVLGEWDDANDKKAWKDCMNRVLPEVNNNDEKAANICINFVQ